MNEDFVTYEIAKKLKEKGFRDECFCFFNTDEELADNISSPIVDRMYYSWNSDKSIWNGGNFDAPTISQVLKWLRKEKNTHIIVDICKRGWFFNIRCLRTGYIMDGTPLGYSYSFVQASLAAIEFALDNIIKEEQNEL